MNIVLDGSVFELKAGTGVRREPVLEWPENIRLDGQQQRKDRRLISSWDFNNWSGGLGIQRRDSNNASHAYRIWDVDKIDTRWAAAMFLSPAAVICTINPSRGDLDIILPHLDQLYFVESSGSYGRAYQFSPPQAIGSFSFLLSAASGDSVTAAYSIGANVLAITGTSVGSLWQVPTIGGAPELLIQGQLYANDKKINPRISDIGGTVHILSYDGRGYAGMHLVNSALGTQANLLAKQVFTSIGSALAPLVSDGLTMYANLPDGIYDFDTAPAIVIDTKASRESNCNQVLFGQDLYFKNKYSFLRYDGTDVVSVGYDREDGLAADKWGEITATAASWKWIFAAVKGATYSNIYTIDSNGVWQYYAQAPSPGVVIKDMLLSNQPDGYNRLWCVPYGGFAPFYYLNPMVNPAQAGTYSHVGSGSFTLPIFDGGMPDIDGLFLQTTVHADEQEVNPTSGQRIIGLYGINGSLPSTATLGPFDDRVDAVTFGSPYGISAKDIQMRYDFYRNLLTGDNGGTCQAFYGAFTEYIKQPPVREQYDFTVDLELTARRVMRSAEEIIGTLNAIRDKVPLVAFQYGLVPTKAVKTIEIPGDEFTIDNVMMAGERKGIINIRVAELL